MTEQENNTKDLKFYSQRAIGMATFIGGPLAAGFLIRENYLALNKPDEAKYALIIGIIATFVLFASVFMLPENFIDKVPSQLIPFVNTGIVYLIVEKIHGNILKKHKDFKNQFFSGWKAAGIGLISVFILFIGIFGYAYLAPVGPEYEMYDKSIAEFTKNETETLVFYNHLNTETKYSLLEELDKMVIPKWKQNIEIVKESNQIQNLPSEMVEQNALLLNYAELRLDAFKLFKKAISEDSDAYNEALEQIHIEIDKQLEKLN